MNNIKEIFLFVWPLLLIFHIYIYIYNLLPTMGKSRKDWPLEFWYGNRFRRRKTLNSNLLNSAYKIDVISHICLCGGVGKSTHTHTHIYIYIYIYIYIILSVLPARYDDDIYIYISFYPCYQRDIYIYIYI